MRRSDGRVGNSQVSVSACLFLTFSSYPFQTQHAPYTGEQEAQGKMISANLRYF